MHKPTANKLFCLVVSLLSILLLSACHSKYLSRDLDYGNYVAWNADKSAFAFVVRNRLYRSPEGIAKFPDGGKGKNEYRDFSIYYFDIKANKLNKLVNLNEFYRPGDYTWSDIASTRLYLKDSVLLYKFPAPSPSTSKHIKEHVFFLSAKKDKIKNAKFLADIGKTYKYNLLSHEKSVVDSAKYKNIFEEKKERLAIGYTRNILAKITDSDWGVNLKDIYPQSKKTYMEYIISGQWDKSILAAVYEQIVPDFDQKDKEYILKKMQERKEKLLKIYQTNNDGVYQESLKKDRYEDYIKYMKETELRLSGAK